MSEFRYVGGLAQRDGMIEGVVYDPDDVAPPGAVRDHGMAERIEPGAFGPAAGVRVVLNVMHDFRRGVDSSFHPGGGLQFRDTDNGGMRFRAQVSPEVHAAVRAGRLRGTSVEFDPLEERVEDRTRVIRRGRLLGLALVDQGAYPSARVAFRRARARVSGSVALGTKLACRCRRECDSVEIDVGAFDDSIAETLAGEREVFAFATGRYGEPLASVGSGLTLRREGTGLLVDLDLADTEAARRFLESEGTAFWTFRPYWRDDEADWGIEGTVAKVASAPLRAIELAAISGPTEGLRRVEVTRPARRRRRRVWL